MMKSIPNFISYLHEFSKIFTHLLPIFLVRKGDLRGFLKLEKLLTRGVHLSVAMPHAPCPSWLTMVELLSHPCLKGAILTATHVCPSAPPHHFGRASAPSPLSPASPRHHEPAAPPLFFWLPPLSPSPSSTQVAEAVASPPTEPERAVYHEPPSPSAPLAGKAAMSPPLALFIIDCAALSPEAKSEHAHGPLGEATAVMLPCPSTVRQA
jgi:hypothetical protein